MKKMKTREQAELRAMELYEPSQDALTDHIRLLERQAFLQCWEDMQVANEARQAADEVDNDKLRESIKDNSQICGFCVNKKSLHLSP